MKADILSPLPSNRPNATSHLPLATSPCRKGTTLIELIVVMLIMLVLTSLTMSAMQTMKKGSRVNKAADQVVSMLHLCRNMAISNNAMYFVRIENVDVDPGTGQQIDSTTGLPFPDMIGIYYFENARDAVNATSPSAAWTQASLLGYPHVLVQRVALDQNCWYGINPSAGSLPVVGFNPDGTSAGPIVQLFITDNPDFRNSPDNGPIQAANDAKRQSAINSELYGAPNAPTHSKLPGKLSLVRVFAGGLIKREF